MTTRADELERLLQELIARVEAASGVSDDMVSGQPLRELDCYLWALVAESAAGWRVEENATPHGVYLQAKAPPENGTIRFRQLGLYQEHNEARIFLCSKGRDYIPPYTSSLDAAIKLVEEKLPGRSWQIRKQTESSFPSAIGSHALIMAMAENETLRGDFSASAPTPALAILIALVEALRAQAAPPTKEPG